MSELDELINELESERFVSEIDKNHLLMKACSILSDELPETYSVGIKRFAHRTRSNNFSYSENDIENDLDIAIEKLKMLRLRMNHEIEIEKLKAAQRGATVIISEVGNSSSSATVTLNVSITSTVEKIDDSDVDEHIKDEIKAAILDLEAAKSNNPESVADKALKVLDIATKAGNLVSIVAPLVASALSRLN